MHIISILFCCSKYYWRHYAIIMDLICPTNHTSGYHLHILCPICPIPLVCVNWKLYWVTLWHPSSTLVWPACAQHTSMINITQHVHNIRVWSTLLSMCTTYEYDQHYSACAQHTSMINITISDYRCTLITNSRTGFRYVYIVDSSAMCMAMCLLNTAFQHMLRNIKTYRSEKGKDICNSFITASVAIR